MIDAHVHFWKAEHTSPNTWFFGAVTQDHYAWWIKKYRNIDVSEGGLDVDVDYRSVERALRNEGVEGAVAFAMAIPRAQDVPNEYVAEGARETKGFFTGIASVNPHDPKSDEQLEYAISSLGLKGLKLFPIIQHFRVDDFLTTDKLYRKCNDHDVAVVIHLAAEPAETGGLYSVSEPAWTRSRLVFNQATQIDEVSYKYPELRIVVAHANYGVNVSEAAFLCARRPNVYVDLARFGDRYQYAEEMEKIPSERRDESLYRTYEAVGLDWIKQKFEEDFKTLLMYARPNRVIFGTDFPAISPKWYKKKIEGIVVDGRSRDMIFKENARKAYKI